MITLVSLLYLVRVCVAEIHVNNLEGSLPDVGSPFVGRDAEVSSLAGLLDTSGRLVTITGESGCGKSQTCIAVGHAVVTKHRVTAIYVDARGCATRSAVCRRLQLLFDLHMRETELSFLWNWFNSHEQRLLFVFDNVDPATSRDASQVSAFVDELAVHVHNVRVLCTSRRAFYVGSTAAATSFALGDLRQDSETLLRQLTPDLHDDGIRDLATACGHVVQTLMVASRGLTMADVDAGQLFEDLTTRDGETEEEHMDGDGGRSRKVLACLRTVLRHMDEHAASLLRDLSRFTSRFDVAAACQVATLSDEEALTTLLIELAKVGFLVTCTRTQQDLYYMPHNTRLLANSLADVSDDETKYKDSILGRIRILQDKYYSSECSDALRQFSSAADEIETVLRTTVDSGMAYRECSHLAAIDSAVFLHETLPSVLYEDLYEAIRKGSDDDFSTQCRALCCLAHHEIIRGNFPAAKRVMSVAHDVTDYLAKVDDMTKAFCYECLGHVYWSEPDRQDPALALMKRALDIYKAAVGMHNARSLLANEQYAGMLARRMRLQSARHFFNVSDFAITEVLGAHALLVRSYDQRRVIWESLQLYGRSVESAKKSADIARRYKGEHPLTADMLARLCDSVMKRGSLNDAIDTATDALHMRLKVLGDHDDTAVSYKVLAYLMVRSAQYDEAIRFAQAALDIYTKSGSEDRRQELDNMIAQARYRLEYKSNVFVQLESSESSRTNMNEQSSRTNMNEQSSRTNINEQSSRTNMNEQSSRTNMNGQSSRTNMNEQSSRTNMNGLSSHTNMNEQPSRTNMNERAAETRAIAASTANNDSKGKTRGSIKTSPTNGERRINTERSAPGGQTRINVDCSEDREKSRSNETNGDSAMDSSSSATSGEISVNRVCTMSTEV